MHLTTATLASTVALVITATGLTTAVSAQACINCVLPAAIASSPTCDAVTLGTANEPMTMTPTEKVCFCPLASSDAWIKVCIKPGACSAVDFGVVSPQFMMDKDIVCAGVSNPSSGDGTSSTNTSSLTTTTTVGGTTTGAGAGAKPTVTAPGPGPVPPKNGSGSLISDSRGFMGGVVFAETVVSASLLT